MSSEKKKHPCLVHVNEHTEIRTHDRHTTLRTSIAYQSYHVLMYCGIRGQGLFKLYTEYQQETIGADLDLVPYALQYCIVVPTLVYALGPLQRKCRFHSEFRGSKPPKHKKRKKQTNANGKTKHHPPRTAENITSNNILRSTPEYY